MFIRTEQEIKSLMPTARWSRPSELYGYLEEEERVALEPLLGSALYLHLCEEVERLRKDYGDITSTTIKPTGKARQDPGLPSAHITDRLDEISEGTVDPSSYAGIMDGSEEKEVSKTDMQEIRLLRICQRIEFYRMFSHKAWLLSVSFNEGGGLNNVSAEGYEPAETKQIEQAVKDAYMSAGRATDDLLLFLESDAKHDRVFTDLWKEADAFYLHRDLLFQTAKVLNEYIDIGNDRKAYVQLVRDIRFCQNTYIKPRIGAKLLKEIVNYANGIENVEGSSSSSSASSSSSSSSSSSAPLSNDESGETETPVNTEGKEDEVSTFDSSVADELLNLLRIALGFYVESRRTDLPPTKEKLARRDSLTDAQQAMATAEQYVADNLDSLGEAAKDTPAYKKKQEEETRRLADEKHREEAEKRRCREQCEQRHRKLFTAFPATHRYPEYKS